MFSLVSLGTALVAAQAALAAPYPGKKADSYDSYSSSTELDSSSYASNDTSSADYGYSTSSAEAYATSAYDDSSYDAFSYEDSSYATSSYEDSSYATSSYETSAAYETSSATYETSSVEYSTSTVEYSTSTSEASSYTSVSYGSGSSSWNSGSYDSCVQQCIAEFGNPMGSYTPSSSSSYSSDSSGSTGSSGSGATHTVIVAPSQGVLRYVPFATNASVGDTIKFMWNANMHTVTKSSELELCNKTSDSPFTSGVQNQSFVFTQVVNDTNPTFFYCGVPTHCQKGMFGIINPPASTNSSTSAESVMSSLASNDSNVAAWSAYASNSTANNSAAANWGASIDTSAIPEWAMSDMAANIMYTRTFLAANPDVVNADGTVDLGATSAALMVPQDLDTVLDASSTSSTTSATAGTGAVNAESGSASSSPTSTASSSSAARGIASSSVLAGIVALGAAFLAL